MIWDKLNGPVGTFKSRPNGPGIFEPEASALQGQRSTAELRAQSMIMKIKNKKEVIQPQVPLRLPCDDLTLLAELRFELIKNQISSKPYSGGLTGGVCKEQGHIHQGMMNPDY